MNEKRRPSQEGLFVFLLGNSSSLDDCMPEKQK